GFTLGAAAAGVVAIFVVIPDHAAAIFAYSLPILLGTVAAHWRRIDRDFGLTVTDTAEGLGLRSGLLLRVAETIRPGRIQAIRLLDPVLWRPFGWCRVEVDIASRSKKGRRSSQTRALRPVLPVATYAEARTLLERLVPGMPDPTVRSPRRA